MAEFPIALLGDSVPADQKTIEFEDTLEDWSTGRTIIRRVCITGSDKFGLPTAKDEEVLMGLIQLTRITNDFTSPEVWFVKREVIELLGWEERGWSYDRVEESLHRWKGVSIHYWNAWRDHESGTWRDSAAVGVIEYFSLTDGRFRGGGQTERGGQSCFCWNKLFFQSFQAGYLKKLDFSVYRGLKGAAAKRAYRFLDKRFYHRNDWKFDLRQFACEKLGFSRAYTTGQLKERVRPVLGELEQVGFIEPHTMKKERPKIWTLSVTKKSQKTPPKVLSDTHPVETELVTRGVKSTVATALRTQFPADHLMAKLRYVDWLVSRNDTRIARNVAGFLVTCIRKDYPLPEDYLKSLKTQVRETRRVRSPQGGPATVGIESQEVIKDAIDEKLNAMSDREREETLLAAITEASEFERSSLERVRNRKSALSAELERSLLRKHLAGKA